MSFLVLGLLSTTMLILGGIGIGSQSQPVLSTLGLLIGSGLAGWIAAAADTAKMYKRRGF